VASAIAMSRIFRLSGGDQRDPAIQAWMHEQPGAELADPAGLLGSAGKSMRHVKLRADRDVDATALTTLIESAYADVKRRLQRK
jgi:Domain of unknown function (DU1801)